MAHADFERYCAACDFPGVLNEGAINANLAAYLKALGVARTIKRLPVDWRLEEHPSLERYVIAVLNDFAKRPAGLEWLNARAARDARDASDALAARDASDASDARDALDALDALAARAARDASDASDAARSGALHRFAQWCVQAWSWSYWRFELSWIATTHFGAKTDTVRAWSAPLFEAYVAGAWLLHWTDDTLYWVAKPTVHVERTTRGQRRLHNSEYAALESDVENLYFWHGVLVPAFVVVKPEWITVKHIETETNAEVRRVMIDRYGPARYVADSGAVVVHEMPADHDLIGLRTAKLLRKDVPDDEPIIYVDLLNSTTEPDGTVKRYQLRCDPNAYGGEASRNAHAAAASTWRNADGSLTYAKWRDYAPSAES